MPLGDRILAGDTDVICKAMKGDAILPDEETQWDRTQKEDDSSSLI